MKKYILEKIQPKERYYEVYINADSNDGDYISTTSIYTQIDDIIDELINLVNNYGREYELQDYENECNLNIPCDSDCCYCHTLIELSIRMFDTDGSVYNVILL